MALYDTVPPLQDPEILIPKNSYTSQLILLLSLLFMVHPPVCFSKKGWPVSPRWTAESTSVSWGSTPQPWLVGLHHQKMEEDKLRFSELATLW